MLAFFGEPVARGAFSHSLIQTVRGLQPEQRGRRVPAIALRDPTDLALRHACQVEHHDTSAVERDDRLTRRDIGDTPLEPKDRLLLGRRSPPSTWSASSFVGSTSMGSPRIAAISDTRPQ
jgi:hypothetical protein